MSTKSLQAQPVPVTRANVWGLLYWRWLSKEDRIRFQAGARPSEARDPRRTAPKLLAVPSLESIL